VVARHNNHPVAPRGHRVDCGADRSRKVKHEAAGGIGVPFVSGSVYAVRGDDKESPPPSLNDSEASKGHHRLVLQCHALFRERSTLSRKRGAHVSEEPHETVLRGTLNKGRLEG
jgi:hypothetical protein